MNNKYLEKIAFDANTIDNILREHTRRYNEIEEPISQMHKSMDELEYAARDNKNSPYHSDSIERIRDLQESNLRNRLDTFGLHKINNYNTATSLLDHGGISHVEGSFTPEYVINTFKNINRERNGQVGLTYLGTLAGGIGGGIAGRSLGPLGAVVGGVAGSIGANYLSNFALKPSIERRSAEILRDHNDRLSRAFTYMKNHVSKG